MGVDAKMYHAKYLSTERAPAAALLAALLRKPEFPILERLKKFRAKRKSKKINVFDKVDQMPSISRNILYLQDGEDLLHKKFFYVSKSLKILNCTRILHWTGCPQSDSPPLGSNVRSSNSTVNTDQKIRMFELTDDANGPHLQNYQQNDIRTFGLQIVRRWPRTVRYFTPITPTNTDRTGCFQ